MPQTCLGSTFPPRRDSRVLLWALFVPPYFRPNPLLFFSFPSRSHLQGLWLQSRRTPHFSCLIGVSTAKATYLLAPTHPSPLSPSNRHPASRHGAPTPPISLAPYSDPCLT